MMSRINNKVNGGITSKTTLLTTYMPPQIEAAVRPAIKPANVWCLCIVPDYIEIAILLLLQKYTYNVWQKNQQRQQRVTAPGRVAAIPAK